MGGLRWHDGLQHPNYQIWAELPSSPPESHLVANGKDNVLGMLQPGSKVLCSKTAEHLETASADLLEELVALYGFVKEWCTDDQHIQIRLRLEDITVLLSRTNDQLDDDYTVLLSRRQYFGFNSCFSSSTLMRPDRYEERERETERERKRERER
eukprot:sb/3473286/